MPSVPAPLGMFARRRFSLRSITETEPEAMLATNARSRFGASATMCEPCWSVSMAAVTFPASTSTISKVFVPSAVTATSLPRNHAMPCGRRYFCRSMVRRDLRAATSITVRVVPAACDPTWDSRSWRTVGSEWYYAAPRVTQTTPP